MVQLRRQEELTLRLQERLALWLLGKVATLSH